MTTVRFRAEADNFLSSPRPYLLSLGIKRLEREVHPSPLSNAEVKNARSFTSTPSHVVMARYFKDV
jgi:hypothetical protein